MPINTRELMEAVVAMLTEKESVKVCVMGPLKGGMVVGASTVAGSIFLGPMGLSVGGTLGGLTTAYMNKGKYKSVGEVIVYEVTPKQQAELKDHILNGLRDFDITDMTLLLPIILNNTNAQRIILQQVTNYVQGQMGYKLTQ